MRENTRMDEWPKSNMPLQLGGPYEGVSAKNDHHTSQLDSQNVAAEVRQ